MRNLVFRRLFMCSQPNFFERSDAHNIRKWTASAMTHPYLRFVASYGCRNDPTRLLKNSGDLTSSLWAADSHRGKYTCLL